MMTRYNKQNDDAASDDNDYNDDDDNDDDGDNGKNQDNRGNTNNKSPSELSRIRIRHTTRSRGVNAPTDAYQI